MRSMETRFSRRPEVDPATRFYRQVEEYLIEEIERSPELMEEMRALRQYVRLMQQLLPWRVPSIDQDHVAYLLTRAIEAPIFPLMPITLPLPGKTIDVGEHMKVTRAKAEEVWPNRTRRRLRLDDDARVTPVTPIGRIDIVRNLPRLDTDAPLIGFTRRLITSSIGSLRELAQLSESGENRLLGLKAFGGISHLARIGRRFGFTVFNITSRLDRERATAISRNVAEYVSRDNSDWRQLAENYKPAKTAFISRQRLIDLFGSKGPDNIRTAIRGSGFKNFSSE